MKYKLKDLVQKPISGEWGDEDLSDEGVRVLRTTNFTTTGEVDYTNVVTRLISEKKISEKGLKVNDIIIEKSGGGPKTPVGRVVFFDEPEYHPILSNNFTAILRPKPKIVNPKYLHYLFLYLYQIGKVKKYQNQTTGIYNLKIDRYLNEEVEVPSLLEQSKWVAKLDSVRKVINDRKQADELFERFISSRFVEMFFENANQFEYLPLKDTKGIISRLQGTGKKSNSEGIGLPMLRMNNISYGGEIQTKDLKWVQLSSKEQETFKLRNRHVLFNRSNSPDLVGKIGVWNQGDGYTFAGYLVRLELEEEVLNPYYLAGFFNSDFGKMVLKNKARLSGNLANISGSTLLDQLILLPPIESQKDFENLYLGVSALRNFLAKQLESLQTYFQVSLQSAFSENAQINEEEVFESLLEEFSTEDLKQGERLQYLLNWLNCERPKFTDRDQYNEAWGKLRELLEDGSIEQVLEKDSIILKVAR